MFEQVIIRPHEKNLPFDLGQILESMFFYQNTIVHVGRQEIMAMFKILDDDLLVELLKRPELKIAYRPSHPGLLIGAQNEYGIQTFSHRNLDLEKILYDIAMEVSVDKQRSMDFAKRITPLLKINDFPENFNDTLLSELHQNEYRNSVLLESIKYNFPNHDIDSTKIQSSLVQTSVHPFLGVPMYRLDTNIDLAKYQVSQDQIFMNAIVGTSNIQAAVEAGAEIIVPDLQSGILRAKIEKLMAQTEKSKDNISHFNEYIYEEASDFREAINNGADIKDFLKILDDAAKYKQWLNDVPNDKKLLNEYINKNSEKAWIANTKAKGIRFYIFTGIGFIVDAATGGAAGLATALGLSIFDGFIADNLIKKWTPNQFIEKKVLPAIK